MVLWSIAGYSANPQVSLTAHGTGAYYWDDALVEESAKKMTPAKFRSKRRCGTSGEACDV